MNEAPPVSRQGVFPALPHHSAALALGCAACEAPTLREHPSRERRTGFPDGHGAYMVVCPTPGCEAVTFYDITPPPAPPARR